MELRGQSQNWSPWRELEGARHHVTLDVQLVITSFLILHEYI